MTTNKSIKASVGILASILAILVILVLLSKNRAGYFEWLWAPKTIVVNNELDTIEDELIYKTLTEAIGAAHGKDTILIYGDDTNPYQEQGILLPNGITIIGIGRPWIKGELSPNSQIEMIDKTSTLDAFESCTLKNLKITALNMRYPIHADFSSGNTTKIVVNCSFIHMGNVNAYDYNAKSGTGKETEIFRGMSAWGGGTKSGDRVFIDSCYFESPMRAFSTHNNIDFDKKYGRSIVKVSNSRMVSHGLDSNGSNISFTAPILIQGLQSNTKDSVIFENCEADGYICFYSKPTQEVIMDIAGLKQVWNTVGAGKTLVPDWEDLDVNWYAKINGEVSQFINLDTTELTRGKAVKRLDNGIALYTSKDSISHFYGILMQDVKPGESADVKFAGYLPWKYFDGVNSEISEGDSVSVDERGNFMSGSSHPIAIAVDNNNVLIK